MVTYRKPQDLVKAKKLISQVKEQKEKISTRIAADKRKKDYRHSKKLEQQLDKLRFEENRLETRVNLEKQVAEKQEEIRKLKGQSGKTAKLLKVVGAIQKHQESVVKKRRGKPARNSVLDAFYLR